MVDSSDWKLTSAYSTTSDTSLGMDRRSKMCIRDRCGKLGTESLEYREMLATSSAAGGLKMTLHGLVYDMTAKAAREAALGAGGSLPVSYTHLYGLRRSCFQWASVPLRILRTPEIPRW